MVGVIIWALAVIAIFLLLKGYYDYKYFIACYDGLIFSVKWIGQFLLGRWKWLRSLRALKQAYVIIAGFTAIALFILFFRLYLEIILFDWGKTENIDSSIRNLALAFLGTVSGIGALFGVYLAILRSEENTRQNKIANDQNEIANDQNEITEQGLITDRINKATEGLGKSDKDGNPVIEVRLGALYALERIAKDSERDHVPIMEIFCAYIRTNSSNDDKDVITKTLREDIKIILDIIRRRHKWEQGKNRLQIEKDQGLSFNFYNCYLKNAELYGANLSNANFYKANLENAWFNGADLSKTRLLDANMKNTKFKGVKTFRAYATSGDFSKCKNLTQEQLDVMCCGESVKIPDGLTRPDHWPEDKMTDDVFIEFYKTWRKEN